MCSKQQRTILIIDDTPHDRETYRRYLEADQNNSYTILEEELAEAEIIDRALTLILSSEPKPEIQASDPRLLEEVGDL